MENRNELNEREIKWKSEPGNGTKLKITVASIAGAVVLFPYSRRHIVRYIRNK